MFKSYWTMASRILVRNKIYTLVNVLGLALGICACLVIYLITSHELSFDTFHPDRDRIYCVDAGMPGSSGDLGHWNCVPGPMPAAMRWEMTGFETVAAFQHYSAKVRIPGGPNGKPKKFDDGGRIAVAEPQYFDIFRYRWLSGNATTSLSRPNTVVLTASKAREYFGDLAPDKTIGRSIFYQDSLMVTVTGVVADWTGNSDFNFSQWISYSTIRNSFLKNELPLDGWFQLDHSSQVMVKLAKGVDPSKVDAQFIAFAKRHLDPQSGFAVLLKPLSGIHFHREYGGEGNKASLPVLYTLMGVAGFILILAFINFVNLSTAQSMQRAREVGIRKVLGGGRRGIAVQFFTETLLLTVAAVILAVLLVGPVLSGFANFIPQGVHFRLMDAPTLFFLLSITAVTTLVAGFYPAKTLADYLPALTLKGTAAVEGGGKGTLRKSLIVFQFTISLLFIIASIVIGSQIRYMLHADLGFRADAIITLRPMWNDKTGKMAVLADKVRKLKGVDRTIREALPPMGRAHMGDGAQLKGSDQKPFEASIHAGNEDFLPFYGMRLVAGRNLLHSDSTRELLINETCAHDLGFSDVSKALGRQVVVGGGDKAYPIAGVVADFYENSLHQQIMPVIIKHDPAIENAVAVRIAAKGMAAGELKTLMGRIEQQWKALYPEEPFGFSFLDESIANLYAGDIQMEWLTNVAMGITIFISCLGLLGLAIFSTERRTKEIGIRKVLGATVSGIVLMLCRDIVRLILIALLIATPLAWYFMHGWLQGFAYRTQLSGWMFVAAGAAAIGLALLTVGSHAMKAAMANPVKSLRTE
ncbi:MAG TPA: ABC transporter permease [Puia sp.]|nr:ABC transporter permease [Puia sp.]